MVGWHHRLNGHELGQSLGDDEGQGGLIWRHPWGPKESDMTWQLNNTNNNKSRLCGIRKKKTKLANRSMESIQSPETDPCNTVNQSLTKEAKAMQ